MAVTVQVGANAPRLEGLAGKTVADIREAFAGIYAIDDNAVAQINGFEASDSETLSEGDVLSFTQPLAQKGS